MCFPVGKRRGRRRRRRRKEEREEGCKMTSKSIRFTHLSLWSISTGYWEVRDTHEVCRMIPFLPSSISSLSHLHYNYSLISEVASTLRGIDNIYSLYGINNTSSWENWNGVFLMDENIKERTMCVFENWEERTNCDGTYFELDSIQRWLGIGFGIVMGRYSIERMVQYPY